MLNCPIKQSVLARVFRFYNVGYVEGVLRMWVKQLLSKGRGVVRLYVIPAMKQFKGISVMVAMLMVAGVSSLVVGCKHIAPLLVNCAFSGSAENGADYNRLSNFFVIPAGAFSATVTGSPLEDALAEGVETVSVSLSGAAHYNLGGSSNAVYYAAG